MAVVRQQRQNVSRSIGVIRADTGEAASWRSVGQLADNMIQDSFEELKRQAKERGIETAQAASAADLRSIDPLTGEPIAFQVPNDFGRAAQDAYKEIIERRYVAQTETDFKQKAAELSQIHRYKPNGSALFDAEFGKFVEETSKNTAPRFSNIINQVGSSLQASYKLTLTAEEAQIERTSAANSVIAEVEQSSKTLASLHSSPSFKKGSDSYESAQVLLEDRLDQIEKARVAFPDLITETKVAELKAALTQAMFEGSAQRIIAKIAADPESTSLQVNDIRQVIQSGGVGLDDLPSSIREDVRSVVENPDFIDNKKSFNSTLTNFQTQLGNAETQERINQSDAERVARNQESINAENAKLGIDNITSEANDQMLSAITGNDIAGATAILNKLKVDLNNAAKTIGSTEGTNNAFTRARNLFQNRIIDQINNKTDYAQMVLVDDYINQEGQIDVDLPNDVRALADAVIKNADYSRDSASIQRLTNSKVAEKKADLTSNAKSQSEQDSALQVATGTAPPSSSTHQETMERAITGSEVNPIFFFEPQNFNDRFQWGQAIGRTRVLPTSLVNGMDNLINGTPYGAEQTKMLLEYYAQFSDVRLVDSTDSLNLFDLAGISSESIGLIEGALYAASFEPNGIDNFGAVLSKLREVRNDPKKFNAQVKLALGDESVKEFADRLTLVDNAGFFTGDTANPNVSFEITPFIEYQIASGKPVKNIESDVRRYFEQHYHKLQGIVIDPAFQVADRSRQGLSGRFGDKVPDVVGILNKQLKEVYGVTDSIFRLDFGRSETEDFVGMKSFGKISQAIEEEISVDQEPTLRTGLTETDARKKRLRLMPLPFSGTTSEDVRYMVIEIDDEGKPSPYLASKTDPVSLEEQVTFIYFSLDQLSKDLANASDL